MKAELKYWHKARIQSHYLLELKIYKIDDKVRYKDSIKYNLICKDLRSGKQILFDNHHPKGPHIHVNDEQIEYEYRGEDKLINDF